MHHKLKFGEAQFDPEWGCLAIRNFKSKGVGWGPTWVHIWHPLGGCQGPAPAEFILPRRRTPYVS